MVFDWTIKVTDIVMIVAVLIGPISAVLITLWAQKRNDKRSAKRQLFLALIGERKSLVISNATANALNSIDVVFSNNQKVRDLWHKYYALLAQNPSEERVHTWLELLSAMAEVLGMSKLSATELDKFYIPQGHVDNLEFQQKIGQEWLRVLENTQHFLVEKRHNPDDNSTT
jgi:hypothetical protein